MTTRYSSTTTTDRPKLSIHGQSYSTPTIQRSLNTPRTAPTLRTKSSSANLREPVRTIRHTPSQQSLRPDEAPRLRTQKSQVSLSTKKEMIKQSPTLWQLAQSRIPQKRITEEGTSVGFQAVGIKVKVQNVEESPKPWPRRTMKR